MVDLNNTNNNKHDYEDVPSQEVSSKGRLQVRFSLHSLSAAFTTAGILRFILASTALSCGCSCALLSDVAPNVICT